MNTAVIVGVGQYCDRTPVPEELSSALDLAANAAKQAILDTEASGDIASAIDTVAWVRTFSDSAPQFKSKFGFSNNPPRSLANRISANPSHLIHSPVGGNVPQGLVNEMAAKIGAGEIEMAILAGGEAIANEVFALRNGLNPDWSEAVDGQCEDRGLGIDELATGHEMAHGVLNFAPLTYTLFENVFRHQQGHSLAEHRDFMADLMAPFVETARANPYSMFTALPDRDAMLSAEQPVTSGYSKHFCAREKVNQGAAVIITSVAKARQLGIPETRWVYLLGGSEATEKTILARRNLATSEALRVACRQLFDRLGVTTRDFGYFDFYSCFPSAVEAAMNVLDIDQDDTRPLTLTGGLPYFGGPGNNYSMHAIAEMADRLRNDREALGLITANGGILSKQAVGVYSAKPPSQPCQLPDKKAVQQEIDCIPSPEITESPNGAAHIETYAVRYSREQASGALIIARLADSGQRCIAVVDGKDESTLQALERDGAIGTTGQIQPRGDVNLFTFTSQ